MAWMPADREVAYTKDWLYTFSIVPLSGLMALVMFPPSHFFPKLKGQRERDALENSFLFLSSNWRHLVISPAVFDGSLFANMGNKHPNVHGCAFTFGERWNKMSLINKVNQPACLGHHEFTLVPHSGGGRMANSRGSCLKASIRIISPSAKVPLLLCLL